ncbi:MAG: REP element-mobilizing transposase RayT [Flammeovirgaceae bacterium]|jgi:putative transposase
MRPYFLTLTTVGWIDVFSRERYVTILINSLNFCIREKGLEVFAYVIMPSHLHLIARSLESKMPQILRDFKSFTAKGCVKAMENEVGESRKDWILNMLSWYARKYKQNANYMFWQKTNYPIELSVKDVFWQKLEYVHLNPVAAGYVSAPEHWNWSSASKLNRVELSQI